jgi:hypothetical protein
LTPAPRESPQGSTASHRAALDRFTVDRDVQGLAHPLVLERVAPLHSPLLQVVHRVIANFLIKQSGLKRSEAHAGAVTLIQRFDSAANIHSYCLLLDGVKARNSNGTSGIISSPLEP